jgi:hypothetical protein
LDKEAHIAAVVRLAAQIAIKLVERNVELGGVGGTYCDDMRISKNIKYGKSTLNDLG